MNASGRRCRQFKNGFNHISGRRRPVYRLPAPAERANAKKGKSK